MQSQDYPGAKWSVGQRVRGGTDAGVDEAFSSGRILRTHVLRPTWHFVSREDIRWLLRLTAPRVHALNAYQNRALGLDGRLFAQAHSVFVGALEGGRQLTRAELAAELAKRGIVARGQRLAYIVAHAELEALICSGALRGKQQTYALLEERAPAARALDREEALAELTRRFFVSHGPATLKHFAWWSGLTMADGKAGLSMAGSELTRFEVDGIVYWAGASELRPRRMPARAWLIPEYDEALIGAKDLGVPDLPRIRRRWQDIWHRPVMLEGRRAGTWRRTVAGNRLVVKVNLFAALDAGQRRLL
ncbi:MAG: winged helix DNA-binding domain-containing protein, partial [Acidobacteria bacterium]